MKKLAFSKINLKPSPLKRRSVNVKLVGVLRKSNQSLFEIKLPEPITISNLMEHLRSHYGIEVNYLFSKNHTKIDETLSLIIVNGREINTLNGLETKIKDGDLVVFIPVAHGG